MKFVWVTKVQTVLIEDARYAVAVAFLNDFVNTEGICLVNLTQSDLVGKRLCKLV